jgi:hypothetical protein
VGAQQNLNVGGIEYIGYLVTITSKAEFDFIHTTMGITEAWIAATDVSVEGEWRWVDGSEAGLLISPTFWASGQPSASSTFACALSTPSGWKDAPCDLTRGVVLEYERQTTEEGTVNTYCRYDLLSF